MDKSEKELAEIKSLFSKKILQIDVVVYECKQ
jgi:hypothetical protein